MTSSNQHEFSKRYAKIDHLVTNKISLANGTTDWQTYTPTLSTGAFGGTNFLFRYRIVGTTLNILGAFTSVSGTAGSGNYSFSLPPGCVAGRPTHPVCGSGRVESPSQQYPALIEMTNTTTFLFRLVDVTAAIGAAVPVWGSTSTGVGLGAALVFGGLSATIELSPTCAAVVGN